MNHNQNQNQSLSLRFHCRSAVFAKNVDDPRLRFREPVCAGFFDRKVKRVRDSSHELYLRLKAHAGAQLRVAALNSMDLLAQYRAPKAGYVVRTRMSILQPNRLLHEGAASDSRENLDGSTDKPNAGARAVRVCVKHCSRDLHCLRTTLGKMGWREEQCASKSRIIWCGGHLDSSTASTLPRRPLVKRGEYP